MREPWTSERDESGRLVLRSGDMTLFVLREPDLAIGGLAWWGVESPGMAELSDWGVTVPAPLLVVETRGRWGRRKRVALNAPWTWARDVRRAVGEAPVAWPDDPVERYGVALGTLGVPVPLRIALNAA